MTRRHEKQETRSTLPSYARAVERCWSACLERAVILSPRDWSLIADWHERGVPLQVIREAVDALMERKRSSAPRGLSAVAPAVEESFAAIAAGRLHPAPVSAAHGGKAGADALVSWREHLRHHGREGGPLVDLLRELLELQANGVPPEELDARLDGGLCGAVPAALLDLAETEADTRLGPYRGRMPGDSFSGTRRRAVVEFLRQRLGLERVAPPGHTS